MKLHIAMLAATLLLSGGASYAQGNKQEKRQKAYMVAMPIWTLSGTGMYRLPLKSMYGTRSTRTCFC